MRARARSPPARPPPDAADRLSVELDLGVVGGGSVTSSVEDAQRAVRVPAVVQPRHRLLPGVAALVEADGALDESRLRRQDAVVDLGPERGVPARIRRSSSSSAAVARPAGSRVEHLDRRDAVVLVRDRSGAAHRGGRRSWAPRARSRPSRGEPRAQELVAHTLAQLGLGEEQEVVVAAPQHPQRRDHPGLRREKKRVRSAWSSDATSSETIRSRKSAASGPGRARTRVGAGLWLGWLQSSRTLYEDLSVWTRFRDWRWSKWVDNNFVASVCGTRSDGRCSCAVLVLAALQPRPFPCVRKRDPDQGRQVRLHQGRIGRQGHRELQGRRPLQHPLCLGRDQCAPAVEDGQAGHFKIDYSGGWGSFGKPIWKTIKNTCAPVRRPGSSVARRGCKAPDGSLLGAAGLAADASEPRHDAVEARASASGSSTSPTGAASSRDRRLHSTGFTAGVPPSLRAFTYRATRSWLQDTPRGAPLDSYGRNVYLDTFNSAYGDGWRRENSFLVHNPSGNFCYGFYMHDRYPGYPAARDGRRATGRSTASRMGPGVTPVVGSEPRARGLRPLQLGAGRHTRRDERPRRPRSTGPTRSRATLNFLGRGRTNNRRAGRRPSESASLTQEDRQCRPSESD